jgi:hypothetical protein
VRGFAGTFLKRFGETVAGDVSFMVESCFCGDSLKFREK